MKFIMTGQLTQKLISTLLVSVCLLPVIAGCKSKSDSTAESLSEKESKSTEPAEPEVFEVKPYEATEDQLLAARLPTEKASQGWVRLFDGYTLFGMEIIGGANWRIEDGSIVVDKGQQGLMCTSMPWSDFELELQFKATAETNSGLFLRTPLDPEDVAKDCYEINIAPSDNPFPTGSIVKRFKTEKDVNTKFDVWRTMNVVCEGDKVQVTVDGEVTCDFVDPKPVGAGRIGLQFNSGRIEFKEILLKPLGLESLLDEDLAKWKKYPDMPGEFIVTDDGWMNVKGGRTQLETKDKFGNFVLLAEYKLPTVEMNSGIFFRCIPGDVMLGYECQLSNEVLNESAVMPADVGTGGIFKRQNARVVAGEVDKWATVVLMASDDKIASWVNGLQVADYYDDRELNENPRRGKRLDPGTIMIQGHDVKTDALLKQIAIKSLDVDDNK